MLKSDFGKVEIKGTKTVIQAELAALINGLQTREVLSRKEIDEVVDFAFLSEKELDKKLEESLTKHKVIDDLIEKLHDMFNEENED
jgi:hypothetical protein